MKANQLKQFGLPAFRSRKGNAIRSAVLRRNQLLREGRLPKPRALGSSDGFGAVALSIPELDFAVIQRMFPDVTSRNAEERTNAWKRFIKSPFSEPYRVGKIHRGTQCRLITGH